MEPTRLNVLIVDDNRSAADALARVLKKQGHEVEAVYDGGTAITRIGASAPSLVLTDLKMEPIDGLHVLAAARAQRPPVEVIVFTAYGAVDVAVKAMRMGARDFLTKPVTVEQVSQRIEQLVAERGALRAPVPSDVLFIAESALTRELLQQLRRAAGVPSPVWLAGEVGSGRGHAALTLHRLGRDANAPFVARDLGREEPWPDRGTVVLPNVDDLAEDLQRALHRSLSQVPEGVRLIATASTDGRRAVSEGRLRPELYYSLAVIVIPVPPLRERPEDVAPLLDHVLDKLSKRYGRPRPKLDPERVRELGRHAWPGNVRELLNLAERLVVMESETLDLEILEPEKADLPSLDTGFDLAGYLDTVERRILVEALRKCGGDRNRVGRLLSVERNTLRYKLNKYGLLDK